MAFTARTGYAVSCCRYRARQPIEIEPEQVKPPRPERVLSRDPTVKLPAAHSDSEAPPEAYAAPMLPWVFAALGWVFAIVAAVFALLSMGGPANLADAGGGLKLVLAVMHVFSGAGITLGILRSTK